MVHHPARNVTQTGCNAISYRRIIWLEREVELSVISIAVVGKAMLLKVQGSRVQGSSLFVTYTIIQGIISSEMEVRTGLLNGQCKKIKDDT